MGLLDKRGLHKGTSKEETSQISGLSNLEPFTETLKIEDTLDWKAENELHISHTEFEESARHS